MIIPRKPTDVKANEWPYNLLEAIGCDNPDDPLDHMSDESEMELALCMSRLTDREKLVIRERYFRQKTLKEIGQIIGTAQERARQIEAKAVRKLRHPYAPSGIILRHGAKAYIEMCIEEKVKIRLQAREAELEEAYQKKMQELEEGKKPSEAGEVPRTCLDVTIDELNLSLRAYNCLNRACVKNVLDLITNFPREEDLMRVRNLGRKSMDEIVSKVQSLGIKWPKEVE